MYPEDGDVLQATIYLGIKAPEKGKLTVGGLLCRYFNTILISFMRSARLCEQEIDLHFSRLSSINQHQHYRNRAAKPKR